MAKQLVSAAPTEIEEIYVENIIKMIPFMLKLPSKRIYTNYDDEVDVLYISFQKPQDATDSEMREDGILMRYRDDTLVGITILDASTRCEKMVNVEKKTRSYLSGI
ncbi:DUF2283 domain-containing protein [Candidatus Poribacteria bacterium]|nr:DUF2283 domain-containing protein [Candidatus Poribacteria bacterium]